MERFLSTLLACSLVAIATALAGDQDTHTITKTFKTNDGFGVASIAGITSRNGRVSSISGVNFFPSASNQFYFPMARSGDKIPEPISFAKEEDGKYTAGQIKYGPGSVSVTSVARSIYPDSTKMKSGNIMPPMKMFKPTSPFKPNDMIFQDPFSAFNPRSLNPWFPNTFMFRQPSFQSYNSMRPGWQYSNISPLFNFWQR